MTQEVENRVLQTLLDELRLLRITYKGKIKPDPARPFFLAVIANNYIDIRQNMRTKVMVDPWPEEELFSSFDVRLSDALLAQAILKVSPYITNAMYLFPHRWRGCISVRGISTASKRNGFNMLAAPPPRARVHQFFFSLANTLTREGRDYGRVPV
jgi:hypothetical protein